MQCARGRYVTCTRLYVYTGLHMHLFHGHLHVIEREGVAHSLDEAQPRLGPLVLEASLWVEAARRPVPRALTPHQ